MSRPFTPQHAQPVSIASLVELEPDTLTAEISRLQNSIAHLQRSNVELLEFCDPPPGADEVEALDDATRAELELSVRENDETIARQEERLVMIRLAMERKLGVGATNVHYDVVGRPNGVQKTDRVESAAPGATAGGEPAPESEGAAGEAPMPDDGEDADGIYL